MKHLKKPALILLSVLSIGALAGAAPASATTLEIGGVTQNSAVTFDLSLKTSTSTIIMDTSGFASNTCTISQMRGTTETYTGPVVTGKLSSVSLLNCSNPVTVHKLGAIEFVHIPNTTNATVYIENSLEMTTGSPFGTLLCKSGSTLHFGTLTGSSSGHATLVANAIVSCSGISERWQGTYTATTPTGLGFSA